MGSIFDMTGMCFIHITKEGIITYIRDLTSLCLHTQTIAQVELGSLTTKFKIGEGVIRVTNCKMRGQNNHTIIKDQIANTT